MNQIIDLSGERTELSGFELAEPNQAAPQFLVAADFEIAAARKFPRIPSRFRNSLQAMVTVSEDVARQCHYAIPRAGKTIEGPSIRFGEMLASAWGNVRVAARTVGETEHFTIARGGFLDLETNTGFAEDVARRITKSNGDRFDVDMIAVTAAASRSIAMRNAIFRGVPKALWWEMYLLARKTIVGEVKTMKAKRDAALAWFKTHGITEQQVFATLGVAALADLGPDQLITLAGFRTSIEDEGKDPEQIFRPADTKAARATTPPPEPKQEPQNPGGAKSPPRDAEPAVPTPGKAASPGTQPQPAAVPDDPAPGTASEKPAGVAPPANAPVEAFKFDSAEAAKTWAGEAREQLEACETPKAIRELKAKPEFSQRLNALHELDEDAAIGISALAFELAEAFGQESGK